MSIKDGVPSVTPPVEALAFDDVLMVPSYSQILPTDVNVKTFLTKAIPLNIPILAAAMDTVCESKMAIAMAQLGGMGVIHKNLSPEQQAAEVRTVKRFESGMVIDPITITANQSLAEALAIMAQHNISGVPVVAKGSGRLRGILTHRDVRFAEDGNTPVAKLMTSRRLITVPPRVTMAEAKALLHYHRIEKLLVVDDDYRCIGLITVKDIEKAENHPLSAKDEHGRLRVAAAIGVGEDGLHRAHLLVKAGVDALIVDTAHGHSQGVINQIAKLRELWPKLQLIGGNIATVEAAQALVKAGANAVKIGIGPGSICTTRIVAGVGVPQFSAIQETAAWCRLQDIPSIADGGIKYSGDLAKALAAGAHVAMIGSLLAGTNEAPGEVFLFEGRAYKAYRGMGSQGAMGSGSADRYFQDSITDRQKFVPEGVEGQVPHKGPVAGVVHQLIGGLRAAMGYVGAEDLPDLVKKVQFRRITNAGLRESHVHDITITREAPNYQYTRV